MVLHGLGQFKLGITRYREIDDIFTFMVISL